MSVFKTVPIPTDSALACVLTLKLGPTLGKIPDMKAFISLLTLALFSVTTLASEQRLTRSQYIDQWKDEAIYQMVAHGIPASITLAQGILESGDGNSELARKSNNHFGIKCHSDWTGGRTYHDDDKKGECFRVYEDARQSYEDHSDFLLRKRYAELFDLKVTDYKGWAKGLKKCGYATASTYAKLLIGIIEANNLTQYDKIGVSMRKKGETPDRGEPVAQVQEETKEELVVQAAEPHKRRKNDALPEVRWSSTKSLEVSDNRIQFVVADGGETITSLAEELELMPWQIRKYNDLPDGHTFAEGELVYIQPKRGRCKTPSHVVQEGETLRSISQQYGIKLSRLRKRNGIAPGAEPAAGDRLSLNKAVAQRG